MADKVINNIKLPNGEIYSVGGAGRFGIKGDYSTHYGIEYCQHGLIENPVGTNDIVVKGGMMLCLPGADTKTTIGSDITYSISSLTDVTVFYAEGDILESSDVYYSVNEPADNGVENYIAWWNPDFGKWQFKSNDTGNVWREAIATPIADVRMEDGNIVRTDYIGYRLLNDDIYGLKNETANIDLSNLTQDGIDVIIKNSAGANLFDTKLLDHILTYEQSKGWALQGTYVYKEAVAGSRYGYPDFYNKCVEEKDLGVATETVLGENTITLYTNANGHTFYDIEDKEAIDTWYNTYGIAWYYGIDTENERVFLPRTKWFIQPSGEASDVNTVNEAGLPNIDSALSMVNASGVSMGLSSDSTSTGAIKLTSMENGIVVSSTSSIFPRKALSFDASDSNPIYGNSDTVQPPSINQLLYICVGNTNVESAVTDVVDVTTTENDTIPLGYSTYQNGIVPNTSWLKSQGQWNDGNVYTTFYNEFVQKIGQPFASGYVKETTEEYDDYDLVINQDDMTFRLPLLDGSEDIISDRYEDLELLASGSPYTAPANGWFLLDKGQAGNQYILVGNDTFALNSATSSTYSCICLYPAKKGTNVNVDYTANGQVYRFRFIYAQGNGSLYFKVANAVQNLELLDAGEVMESLADKISRQDCKAYVTETYINGTSWYRVYSDGWCEQGGQVGGLSVTFLRPFTSLPTVSIGITTISGTNSFNYNTASGMFGNSLTVNGFNCSQLGQCWRACGYIN